MVNAGGAFTVKFIAGLVAESPAASVTLKANEPPPPPVGVPLITPVLLFKLNPGGSVVGLTLHVYGLVPPDAVSAAL
jgi:hypothetical protein